MAGPPSPKDLAQAVGGAVAGATQGVANFVAPGDGEAEKRQQAKKQALEKSMLPPPLLKRLSPVVQEMRFRLDPQPRRIRNDKKEQVHHNRIRVEKGYIALLYYGEGLLGDEAYHGEILGRVMPFLGQGGRGWVIFCDVEEIADAYTQMAGHLEAFTHLETACLVDSLAQLDWDSEDDQGKKDLVTKWMGLDKFKPTEKPGSALTWSHLKDTPEAEADRKGIMDILAGKAGIAPFSLGSKGYMTQLIHDTNWPSKHKTERVGDLTDNPGFDAQQLVLWALGMGTNPDHENYTFIGGLLEVLIDDLGSNDQNRVTGIIAKYNLVKS